MLDEATLNALRFAIVELGAIDHDCKKEPRGENGCVLCDHIDILQETINRHGRNN